MASSPPPKRPRTDGAAQHAAKPKVFNDSILKHIELHPACIAVVDTREFQRLRRLKQLGPTEWVFPGATHQRFAHSIGVSYLAGRLVERLQRNQPDLGIDARDVLCVKLAGLCHDLGHGPLSHTYDGKFVKKAWAKRGIKSDWCHEHSSAEIFARVVERYGLMRGAFATYGLRDEDVHFVQELIYGDEADAPRGWTWRGRGAEKKFLFEIVSNHRNGIDVDKLDYFERDSHHCNIPISFDSERLLMHARAIRDEDGVMTIAYAEKEVWNVYHLFHTRFNLHKRAYQHRVAHAIQEMLCDALLEADDYFTLEGADGAAVRLSDAMHDLDAYAQLSDTVFDLIKYEARRDPRLAKAAALIDRVDRRSAGLLYQHVGEIVVPKEHEVNLPDEAGLLESILRHADKEQLEKLRTHAYVDKFSINYGMKDKNPVDSVCFYLREDDTEGRRLRRDQVSCMVPNQFVEYYVRLYVRENLPELKRAAKAALLDWERDYLGRSSDSAIAPSPTKAAISRSNSLQKPPRLPAVAQPDLPRPPPKADFGHFQAAGP